MKPQSLSVSFLAMLLLSTVVVLRADGGEEGNPSPNGQQLFDTQLIRVANLNVPTGIPAGQQLGPFFLPNGTDSLDAGRVQVLRNRKAQFELRGAAPNVTYKAFFCRFGFLSTAGCFPLVGQLETNDEGNAEALLSFLDNPAGDADNWAGAFIVARTVASSMTNEYVSGFSFPSLPPAEAAGADVDVSGRIASINTASSSFRLAELAVDIFTGPTTKYQKIDSFADLVVSMDVAVKGLTKPDGTILATNVRSEEKGNPHDNKGN
jgi:hypothetical protein